MAELKRRYYLNNESHEHDIDDVGELQDELDKKLGSSDKAVDSEKLDGVRSESFLRSDAKDYKTAGAQVFNDNVILAIGSGEDVEHFWNGTHYYTDVNAGANWYIRDGNSGNATRFTFDADEGHFTSTGEVYANSDARLKSNITPIEDALEKVLALGGYVYDKKKSLHEDKTTRETGVIAQEVLKVLPEAVRVDENDDDGIMSVAYGNLVGLLIEAIKEINDKVDRQAA